MPRCLRRGLMMVASRAVEELHTAGSDPWT